MLMKLKRDLGGGCGCGGGGGVMSSLLTYSLLLLSVVVVAYGDEPLQCSIMDDDDDDNGGGGGGSGAVPKLRDPNLKEMYRQQPLYPVSEPWRPIIPACTISRFGNTPRGRGIRMKPCRRRARPALVAVL